MKNDWENRNVLVLGLGDTGLSCIRWLEKRGARIRAADTRAAPPSLGAVRADHPAVDVATGPFGEALLAGVDAVVASPGVALGEPVLRAAAGRGIPIVGDVEIFAREIAAHGSGARVIAITGTNGKSTVTALAGEMGRTAGYRTVVAGNIGLPVLDALDSAEGRDADLFVLELSSYQLETTAGLALDAAAMLNLTQDHLDRYGSMAAYARAKERIFAHAKTRVVNRDDDWSRGMAGGARTFSFGMGVPKDDLEWGFDASRTFMRRGNANLMPSEWMGIKGLHNAANGLAAHALMTAVGAPSEPLVRAMRSFKGLPHRVEPVAEARGVRFYDDSKGTNVGSTVAALEGFREPVVLIAGGEGKGQDFAPLARPVSEHARAVVLIGRDAAAIESSLRGSGVPLRRAATMAEAVQAAFDAAQPGDAVLLSPACASFDMFRNYNHRGEVFAEAARAIAGRAAAGEAR
ncbi:MAG TPA: UDP-N-acetylmuramoyl-L-alanine--D-glutamate ligase [Usitatibacter sp.]|nr:UDP-N-acetylmuramoyl-L-alanine--D-glutamate ligase [Usitatibacter sp.]